MTGAMQEQSNQNCTGSKIRQDLITGESWGNLTRYDQHKCIRSSLVEVRDGQESNRDSTVPLWDWSVFQQPGSVHRPPLFHGVQWPERASTLYLPDSSLAWVVAFSTSQGEEPQVVNRGWHLVSPR